MSAEIIFVGGPGRSGTSFVADRVGGHPDVATFKDVELKIFGEFGGLLDLQMVLVKNFSPNRAETAFKHFRNMLKSVFTGGYGQPALQSLVPKEHLDALVDRLLDRLQPEGYFARLDYPTFNLAAREFLQGLAEISLEQKTGSHVFLEKTPHNCLQPQFLHELAPTARYLHIYRNPKAIAVSLLNQGWGPSKLEHAIIWVQSYFDAWAAACNYYERLGLPLASYRIEDISEDPANKSEEVCAHLGLQSVGTLFSGANIDQLSRWKNKLQEADYDLLDARLDPLCTSLGY